MCPVEQAERDTGSPSATAFSSMTWRVGARLRRMLQNSAIAAALALAGCGGGGTTTALPPIGTTPPAAYTGPAPTGSEQQQFMNALWVNVANVPNGGVARCGQCHGGTQNPLFARSDNVNLAWSVAITLVNLEDPGSSQLVQQVRSGHNCWLGTTSAAIQACGDTMQTWIENWASGTVGSGTKTIQLVAPPVIDVGSSRNFPADPGLFETLVHEPLLAEYCTACHSSSAPTRQSPYFADADIDTAYAAARAKINLDDPAQSRLVLRLRNEFHNCWTDCATAAGLMEDAIRAFALQVPVTEVPDELVTSKALTMYNGTIASGGNRYEASQIALWEFKEGSGTTAFDTSGVSPAINLSLSGNVGWVGGWGIDVRGGRAQGSTATSRKLRDLIVPTGAYSIEAWAAPANVAQEDARIVTYSAGPTLRNFSMSQTMYSYDFHNRSDGTGQNGDPMLQTAAADEDAQATLQHVVMTYDSVNGRRIYVNGQFTGDSDPSAAGLLGDWDDTFALVLGNEPSGDRQWQGVLRMVAIHNRALTPAQVQANFDAGVGEKFFLLFNVSEHVGAASSYILFEVSQFDSYSYLFYRPTFINLGATWVPPADIPIRAMRIGANGLELPVGQAWRNLDATITEDQDPGAPPGGYVAGVGQVLSSLGTVVPLEKGPDSDQFFLTFEVLGSSSNVVLEPAPLVPPPAPDSEPQPDIGVKTFDEINATMAEVTTVSPNDAGVKATFNTVRQQLPAVEQIETYVSAHAMAIAQLAIAYCDALVESDTLRSAYFPGFDFDVAPAAAFAGVNRNLVIDPLLARMINWDPLTLQELSSQPSYAAMVNELGYKDNGPTDLNLIDRLIQAPGSANTAQRTRDITKATCAAVLASDVVLVQ
jgi:hypothetical protein